MANHWTEEPHGGICFNCSKPAYRVIKRHFFSCESRECKEIIERRTTPSVTKQAPSHLDLQAMSHN